MTDNSAAGALLHKAVIIFLSLLLVWALVRLFLAVTGQPSPLQSEFEQAEQESLPIDIASLQEGQLFAPRTIRQVGEQDRQSAISQPLAVNETSLSLRLDGVIVGSEPGSGFAMIFSGSRIGSYRIGERLPVGQRVVLDQIHADRVILENNGSMETLWLYDQGNTSAGSSTTAVGPITSPSLSQTSALTGQNSYNPHELVRQYSSQFRNNALAADFLTLSEIVRISPEYNNGQLLGYRLSPGEHLKEFIRLGFKTNDIVTQLNGIELNSIANMPVLVETMSSAQQVTLSLTRDGAPLSLDVSLVDLPKP